MSAATIDVPVFDLGRARRGDAVVLQFPSRRPDAAAAVRLRLTRRGRLVVTATAACLMAVAGVLGASSALAGPAVTEPAAVEKVMVLPGQTLWEIAAAAAPAGVDVRDVIIDIRELNGLETSAVFAGQEITVPLG